MSKGGTMFMCYSPSQLWRSNLCKGLILTLFMFITLEYICNLLVYKNPINKVVAPWIAHLHQKFGEEPPPFLLQTMSTSYNLSSVYKNSTLETGNGYRINALMKTNSAEASSNTSHLNTVNCSLVPPNLVGRLKVLKESPPFDVLEKMFSNLAPGGRFRPSNCAARDKVALVIPYRDREEHLRIFLHNLHPLLQRQQLDYGIYVIEETADTKFNRAMLMNIGYVEALKQYNYDCFIFHDVDLIPEDDRNFYTCPAQPRHMSVAINTMNYRLPYKDIFGGVSALSKKHMEIVNGFSNEFWGWGGEDDDMFNRIKHHGLKITRYSPGVARYTMLKHKKDDPNPDRYNKLYKGKYRFKKDGLSNLKYKRIDIVFKKLYTWILVEIEPPK